ncbi:MAG: glycine zipper 2TM domain-containing protein [Herminiimonas sp.]|nr:glycine zipper 2TM domain-containing protein [Herminiimonas sp.]
MLVSLVGVAAITGLIPSTHGTVSPTVTTTPEISTVPVVNTAKVASLAPIASPTPLTATRYMSADGQVFDAVPNTNQLTPVNPAQAPTVTKTRTPSPSAHHHTVRHVARNTYTQPVHSSHAQNYYNQPVRTAERPYYPPQQQHPIQNYVSDMHPVGTGVGAVVGGLLGNQVGGGNGKKLATVAGALLGGYTGNEVSHNRNPLVP